VTELESERLSREVIAQLLNVQRQRVRLRRSRWTFAPLAAFAFVCAGSLLVHRPGTPPDRRRLPAPRSS